MKIKMVIFVFFLLPAFALQAQKGLKGKWEGTITFGGYDKKEGEKLLKRLQENPELRVTLQEATGMYVNIVLNVICMNPSMCIL